MALRHVNRLPDRQEATFIRVPVGATFDDVIREKAKVFERATVVVSLARAQMLQQADTLDPTDILGEAERGTHWILSHWSSVQNFDTPSGNIEPGTYNEAGESEMYQDCVTWIDEDSGEVLSEKTADVVIEKDAEGKTMRVQRKVGR